MYKPYWGEGSNRARNWQRYKQSEREQLIFEEGVDAYVPFSGTLSEKIDVTIAKLKSTMCNIGVTTIKELHQNARLTRVSPMTLVEGGTSHVENLDRTQSNQ
jgi:IMP dehydrogenase